MSTELTSAAAATGRATDEVGDPMLGERWTLSPSVALRPEPFGALAYHFGNRKLTFLKRPELVAVVRALADAPTVGEALRRSDVPTSQWATYVAALRNLAASELLLPAS